MATQAVAARIEKVRSLPPSPAAAAQRHSPLPLRRNRQDLCLVLACCRGTNRRSARRQGLSACGALGRRRISWPAL